MQRRRILFLVEEIGVELAERQGVLDKFGGDRRQDEDVRLASGRARSCYFEVTAVRKWRNWQTHQT